MTRMTFLLPVVTALALASGLATAERVPPRTATLAPTSGEVIVSFKPGAAVTRMHALAARADAATASVALALRAGVLGQRVGRTLEAGAAVSDRVQVVRARGVDAATLAAQLAADPDVEFAVPNGRKRRLAAPNDPLYASGPAVDLARQTGGPVVGQWYLRAPDATVASAIDIEAAWLHSSGSANVVVAVLDTGVRRDHPDLAGANLLAGYDFISEAANANDGDGRDADPSDPGDWISAADVAFGGPLAALGCGSGDIAHSSWHGTSTTSLIGAGTHNGVGMAGAAPDVGVLPLRVLGKCGGSDADIQAAMRWAAGLDVPGLARNNRPARVLSLSLGSTGSCDLLYQQVVNEVLATGAVIVVAAGNSVGRAVGTPANCAGVIGVAGLRHVGTKVGFSDLGPQIALAAPAGNCINIGAGEPCLYPILAATNSGTQGPAASTYTDSFDFSVGTSFAAPLVAATAALMLSAQPALTPAGVRSALRATARPFPSSGVDADPTTGPIVECRAPNASDQLQCYCTSTTCGAGMLDAGAAVRASLGARVVVAVSPTTPIAGQPITLSGGNSTVAPGRSIVGWQWLLIDGGGAATGFGGSTSAATATLQPVAAGVVVVRLVVTDDLGVAVATQHSVAVAAAPVAPASGGGAMAWGWLLALAAAARALTRPAGRAA